MNPKIVEALKDEKTKQALFAAYRKFDGLSRGEGEDNGILNCELCKLFRIKNCTGCPINITTNIVGCDGTPYEIWYDHQRGIHKSSFPFKPLCPECNKLAGDFRDWIGKIITGNIPPKFKVGDVVEFKYDLLLPQNTKEIITDVNYNFYDFTYEYCLSFCDSLMAIPKVKENELTLINKPKEAKMIKYPKGILKATQQEGDVVEIDEGRIIKPDGDLTLTVRLKGDFCGLGYYLSNLCNYEIIKDNVGNLVFLRLKKD